MNSVDVLRVNACISVGMCFCKCCYLQQIMYIFYINTNKTTISWSNPVLSFVYIFTEENFGLFTSTHPWQRKRTLFCPQTEGKPECALYKVHGQEKAVQTNKKPNNLSTHFSGGLKCN